MKFSTACCAELRYLRCFRRRIIIYFLLNALHLPHTSEIEARLFDSLCGNTPLAVCAEGVFLCVITRRLLLNRKNILDLMGRGCFFVGLGFLCVGVLFLPLLEGLLLDFLEAPAALLGELFDIVGFGFGSFAAIG